MITFSVIVPVYKVEKYISQCVDSVLNQSFTDFELILVDDGSPDNSGALCDAYAEKDNRVKVIHKENGGLSSARNCGLDLARGEFIVFLDSDDYWDNHKALELINNEIASCNADIIQFKHRKLDSDSGEIDENHDTCSSVDLSDKSYDQQLAFCVSRQLFDTCAWNKAFRRSLTEKRDLHFTEKIISEDLDWVARLSTVASGLAIVNEPIYIYRKGRPGSITMSLKLKNLVDTKGSIERCLQYAKEKNYSEEFLFAYYSYVAYRYAIWMGESAVVKDKAKAPLKREMRKHKWLLKYDLNKKVKLTKILTGICGFSLSSRILGIYLTKSR